MKVILEITIYSKENHIGLTYTKTFETNLIPIIGEKVTDPLFAENKFVVDVIHDLRNDKVTVILESKEVPDERLYGHIQEITEMHNWKLSRKE